MSERAKLEEQVFVRRPNRASEQCLSKGLEKARHLLTASAPCATSSQDAVARNGSAKSAGGGAGADGSLELSMAFPRIVIKPDFSFLFFDAVFNSFPLSLSLFCSLARPFAAEGQQRRRWPALRRRQGIMPLLPSTTTSKTSSSSSSKPTSSRCSSTSRPSPPRSRSTPRRR